MSLCVTFNFIFFWYSCTFLVAYSKAKFESSGSFSCIPTILSRKSPKQMSTYEDFTLGFVQTLLIRLTSFMGIPYSVRTVYSTTHDWVKCFLEVYRQVVCRPWFSHFLSIFWRMQNNWPVVNLLHLNLHWWYPVI